MTTALSDASPVASEFPFERAPLAGRGLCPLASPPRAHLPPGPTVGPGLEHNPLSPERGWLRQPLLQTRCRPQPLWPLNVAASEPGADDPRPGCQHGHVPSSERWLAPSQASPSSEVSTVHRMQLTFTGASRPPLDLPPGAIGHLECDRLKHKCVTSHPDPAPRL